MRPLPAACGLPVVLAAAAPGRGDGGGTDGSRAEELARDRAAFARDGLALAERNAGKDPDLARRAARAVLAVAPGAPGAEALLARVGRALARPAGRRGAPSRSRCSRGRWPSAGWSWPAPEEPGAAPRDGQYM